MKCVVTIEQPDGSRYWRHLFDHVAGDAVDTEPGSYILLAGSATRRASLEDHASVTTSQVSASSRSQTSRLGESCSAGR